MKAITTAAARLIGFTVCGHGHNRKHYTFTAAEALSWAACYDRATITRRGQFYALKTIED